MAQICGTREYDRIYAEWTLPSQLFGRSISKKWCLVAFYYYHIFIAIYVFNAKSVDPDQTPQNAASDQGQHCLPLSLLRDSIGINGLKNKKKIKQKKMLLFYSFLILRIKPNKTSMLNKFLNICMEKKQKQK